MRQPKIPIPESDLWLSLGGEDFLGGTRIALLQKIQETGSITKAGKAVGISYRTAWDAVDRLNGLSENALVESIAGGKKGGGTRLTEHGQTLLEMYAAYRKEHGKFLENLRTNIRDFARFQQLAQKMSLKVSARNQIWGRVESIRKNALKAEVTLRAGLREILHVCITREGLNALGLELGDDAYALIKANWISLSTKPQKSKSGKTNCLKGVLLAVTLNGNDFEATLKSEDGATLTISGKVPSAKQLHLQKGDQAYALFDPSDVILGVPS